MLCTTNDMKFIPILVEGSGDAWGLDAEDVFKIIIKSTASLCDKTVLKKKLSPRPLKVTQHAAARTQYGSGYQQAMKILSNKYGDSTVGTRDHLLNFVTFYLEKPDSDLRKVNEDVNRIESSIPRYVSPSYECNKRLYIIQKEKCRRD